jgi:acyl carrier protein
MEKDRVIKEVKNIIRSILQDEDMSIELDENLFDLGLNSMKVVELIVNLEEAFEVMIPDHYLDGNNFATIQEISNVIVEII